MDIKNFKRLGITTGIITIILVSLFFYYFGSRSSIEKAQEVIRQVPHESKERLPEEISTPNPLISPVLKEIESPLSNDEIINITNNYRENNNIEDLEENQLLMRAAEEKLEDMLEEQYFAHVSPAGEDASSILKKVSYSYLIVGENLALGYFKDSEDLVNGWMESVGHRENILNPKFKEIGVAQKKGDFQGKEQYLAVQVFATPSYLCPLPDRLLFLQIQEEKEQLERLTQQANELKQEIDLEIDVGLETQEDFQNTQKKIEIYNQLVVDINQNSDKLQGLISSYNLQVNSFNTCIDNF